MLALTADYYKLLSVSPDSTDREIKIAYRRMAEVYHPDKMRELPPVVRKEGEEIMRLLNEAKSVLLDPVKRKEYDMVRTGACRPASEAIVMGEDRCSTEFTDFVIEEGSPELQGKMKRVLGSMREVFGRDKGFQVKIAEAEEIVEAQVIEETSATPQNSQNRPKKEPSEEMTLEFSVVSKGPMKKRSDKSKAKFRIVAVEEETPDNSNQESPGTEKGDEGAAEKSEGDGGKKVDVDWEE